MYSFDSIKTGRVVKPKICILYSTPGLGKTTELSKLDDVFILPVEEGSNDLDVPRLNFGQAEGSERYKAESFDEVLAGLSLCASPDFPMKKIGIDSLSQVEVLIHKKVCEDNKVSQIEEIDYGKGYKFAMKYWYQFIDAIEYLRNKCGLYVFMTAHSAVEKFNDPKGEPYDFFSPQLRKEPMEYLIKNVDAIFFVNQKKMSRKVDMGFGRQEEKAIDTGQLEMLTKRNVTHVAKNRANPSLPESMPFDLNSKNLEYALALWEGRAQ